MPHPGIPEVQKTAIRKVTTILDFCNPSFFRKEVDFRNSLIIVSKIPEISETNVRSEKFVMQVVRNEKNL